MHTPANIVSERITHTRFSLSPLVSLSLPLLSISNYLSFYVSLLAPCLSFTQPLFSLILPFSLSVSIPGLEAFPLLSLCYLHPRLPEYNQVDSWGMLQVRHNTCRCERWERKGQQEPQWVSFQTRDGELGTVGEGLGKRGCTGVDG